MSTDFTINPRQFVYLIEIADLDIAQALIGAVGEVRQPAEGERDA